MPSNKSLGECWRRKLFEEHQDRVYSIAWRYTNDAALAEDIAQEVFIRAFESEARFRGDSSVATWLYRITVNACVDAIRRRSRSHPALALAHGHAAAAEIEADLDRRDRERIVQEAVAALPDIYREAIVLRYTAECSYEEIARLLGCPAGTVAARLNRAHELLRRKLAEKVAI